MKFNQNGEERKVFIKGKHRRIMRKTGWKSISREKKWELSFCKIILDNNT